MVYLQWQRAWYWLMLVHIYHTDEGPQLPLGPCFLILGAGLAFYQAVCWLSGFLTGVYLFDFEEKMKYLFLWKDIN